MRRDNIDSTKKFKGISDDKLIVQKSNPLYGLWRSEITLAEFKILDAYLSRINSRNPETRMVQFSKGELEQLLGVVKINKNELGKRLVHLMKPVEVGDPTDENSLHLVTLFEEASAGRDSNGVWQIRLTCTQAAMEYIFNIESLGYLRYKLRCVTSLGSRYSYILFLYIEKNRYRKTWTISVEELKKILSCENDIAYNEFKRFNNHILNKCHKEITEKTECKFIYTPVRTGRCVTDIQFTVESLPPEIFEDRKELEEKQSSPYEDQYEERLHLLSEMCGNEFSKEEIAELLEDMLALPFDFEDDIAAADFLRRQYTKLRTQAAKNEKKGSGIKNRFSYLKKIIKKAENIND